MLNVSHGICLDFSSHFKLSTLFTFVETLGPRIVLHLVKVVRRFKRTRTRVRLRCRGVGTVVGAMRLKDNGV